jgi:hypothetical protein
VINAVASGHHVDQGRTPGVTWEIIDKEGEEDGKLGKSWG